MVERNTVNILIDVRFILRAYCNLTIFYSQDRYYENIFILKKKYIYMPQLVPFFFVNQVVFTFVILTVLIYTFTKFVLPRFVRTFISRIYINKL